jgi:hypothetical protein
MMGFSGALSEMDLSGFVRQLSADATLKSIQVVENAAISRLRQTQDGMDLWGSQGSAVTRLGAPTPDQG